MYYQHLAGRDDDSSNGESTSQEPLGSSPNEAPFPRKTRAMPQVVTIASPSPSTRSLVWESLSWAAALISCKLCMVTILRERFVPGFSMHGVYRGKHGYPATMDGHIRDFPATQLAGIIAPGGWAPDKLRRDLDVLTRVREVHTAGKLVGTICHGPWTLIDANGVRGRTLTSWPSLKTDLQNAGAS